MNPFFDRVRSDLARSRQARAAELAVTRGFLARELAEQGLREAPAGKPVEELFLERGWINPGQARQLKAELDDPGADPSLRRYEIGEKLGEGAGAFVHRAFDRRLGRAVAVKILKEGARLDPRALERLEREAQALARLDHPHVVKVHDVVREEGRVYLVMELVEGAPLSQRLRSKDPGLLLLLEQAARGVQHAHERGIVHRDLKPDNILVSSDNIAKVADFGLAHWASGATSLTRTGAVMGTPLYMSPEQVRGERTAGPGADVYALGAMLYEILTGRTPHEAGSGVELYGRILSEDPPPPRQINPQAPAALEAVALKALDKEARRRYPDAGAFADELRRFRESGIVEARRVLTVVRVWRRFARNRVALAAGLVMIAAAALFLAQAVLGRARVSRSVAQARDLEQAGKTSAARDAYLAALGLDPDHAGAREGSERAGRALQRATNLLEAARPLLEQARAAMYDVRIDLAVPVEALRQAEQKVREALAAAEDIGLAHSRLGEILEQRGDYRGAGECYRRATALDPRSGPSRYRLGRVLLWQAYLGSLNMWTHPDPAERAAAEQLAREGAREIEQAQVEGSGFDDELRRRIAEVMLAYLREDRKGVRQLCAAALSAFEKREGVEELHWLDGLSRKDAREEVACYDRAIALRPRFPLALYSRAWVLPRVGRGSERLRDFDEAIRCAPEFAEPYIFRGSDYLNAGRTAASLADFDRLIAMGVHLAPAFNGRAGVKLRLLKDYDGAIADASEAIRLKPEGYHIPWAYRAEARLGKEDWDGAIADVERVMEIHREPSERYKHLILRGRARLGKGDRAGAEADFRAAGKAGEPFLGKPR